MSWGSQSDQAKLLALNIMVALHIPEVLGSHLNLEAEKPDRFLQFLEISPAIFNAGIS
jgi:hypothetical protein